MSIHKTESARWLARLDGAESVADRDAFERWLAQPEHAEAHEKIECFWRDLDQLSDLPEFDRLASQVLEDTGSNARRRFHSPVALALAASIVVCVFATVAFVAGRYYLPTRTYVTEAGQRSTVQLEDGSQVVLNFATRLDVKFGSDRREFKVKQGEVLFTVADDPARPFKVFAGNGEVTALGTRFQVRNESKRVVVTLLEGRIAVDRDDQHVQLNPGDQVKFTGAAGMTRRSVDPRTASSWTTGYLEFNATALGEVLDEVNRYSKIKLRLRDPSLARTPVNGAFEVGDSASVVAALELMLPLETAARGRDEIILVRKPGEK